MTERYHGTVMALDLATTTGFAWGRPRENPQFGHTRFALAGWERAKTYRAFRKWLDDTVHFKKVDLIVYESPAVPSIMSGKTNIDTIKLLIGLAEHLEEWAHGFVELREASVSQVRTHFIGRNFKAQIAKPMVFDKCHSFGWMCETNDESDACALWDYQCAWLDPQHAVKNTPMFRGT
jgi:hypothetical protein